MSRTSSKTAVPSELLDRVFSALSHPARRQIAVCLVARRGVMTAGEIADRFKHSWPTTTRHLGVLESAGLIEVTKNGRQRLYALRPDVATLAARWITSWSLEGVRPGDRPSWADLPFAKMRNASGPATKDRPAK